MALNSTYPRRRQNKSCDQCRAGKRRCDVEANLRYGTPKNNPNSSWKDSHTAAEVVVLSSCSNCKKWSKCCTIDWIKAHQKRSQPKGKSRPASKQVNHEDQSFPYDTQTTATYEPPNFDQLDLLFNDHGFLPTPSEKYFDASTMSPMFASNFDSTTDKGHAARETIDSWHQLSYTDIPFEDHNSTSTKYNENMFWTPPPASEDHVVDDEYDYVLPRRQSTLPDLMDPTNSQSPFMSHFLAEEHNRFNIKTGLVKIYHDSLEGALSCWLTERNCPYTSRSCFDGRDVWSSNWSNRIVTRVQELDRSCTRIGVLSLADQRQASNVLTTVIMAFAAQWAQPESEGQDAFSPRIASHGVFGRDMQQSLWYKANRAVNDSQGNTSFSAIFAAIIFSLVQRPMSTVELFQPPRGRGQLDINSLHKILENDTGPIPLDIAVRKLHDHQRRLSNAQGFKRGGRAFSDATQELSPGDKETFGLVFWLAIMFDTLSAAMNRRSFALADRDTNIHDKELSIQCRPKALSDSGCDLDGYSGYEQTEPYYQKQDFQVWGNYFLEQQTRLGIVRKQNIRWPCSYIDAASCLSDAAPVKVLLFRRVAHLQDLYYQYAPADQIEAAITSSLDVYNHWNNTYGQFIADCMAHHDNLPARIQSWYVVLASHWHLAIFILADLIEWLDEADMTTSTNCTTREAGQFSTVLRLRSVYAISDLGQCSSVDKEDLSFPRSPNFHHAVNKTALLTEPWTVVLVRSFAYAGAILAKLIHSKQDSDLLQDEQDVAEARSRLKACTDALWILARKSDMAFCAAQVLQAQG